MECEMEGTLMSERVPVKPHMLRWALSYAQRTETEASKKWPQIDSWLSGERGPTVRQFEDFAAWTHLPASLLLTDSPLDVPLPITDFRVGRSQMWPQPSSELLDTIRICQGRQDWFSDYAAEFGISVFQGELFERGTPPDQAGSWLRKELAYEVTERRLLKTPDAARTYLIDSFEDLGGLAVVNSVVGNNTHRKLDPAEFRGFTLFNPTAPLIFINSADAKNGQIFSLAHEFAHVWRGDSGVSAEELGGAGSNKVESWCNQVAAEFLVPAVDLRNLGVEESNFADTLTAAAKRYLCSTLVIIIRLRELRLLDPEFLNRAYGRELARISAEGKSQSGGGNFHASQRYRLGKRFSTHIVADTLAGRTSFTRAMRLTGLSRTTLSDFISAQQVA